jgi:mannose-6-phosphate isomerase-like protein (cupin superfamily)
MHKSRLAGFIIDCQTDDLPGSGIEFEGFAEYRAGAMKKVRIHLAADIPWTRIRDRAGDPPPRVFSLLAESELDSSMTFHEFGSDQEPQLAELEYLPGAEAVMHKHDDDEIIYVVRGTMRFGGQVLTAGSSVYIPGNTYYSFTAGAEGLRIVNFRARCDVSFYAQE